MVIVPKLESIVAIAIQWVKESLKSKSRKQLEIDELKRKINQLVRDNELLAQRQEQILVGVLSRLQAGGTVIINNGRISVLANVSRADSETVNEYNKFLGLPASYSCSVNNEPLKLSGGSYFDGVEEAIADARRFRPSEREK